MRWLAVTAVVAGCSSSPSENETVLPPSDSIRHGVWLAGARTGLYVAASSGGAVVRESSDASVKLLGTDLTTASSLEIEYAFDDERYITDLARDESGIAVVTLSRRQLGDTGDADVQRHLAMYDAGGAPAWRSLLAEGNISLATALITLGADQIYIASEKAIDVVSRATGEPGWHRGLGAAVSLEAAADPTGGVVVTGNFTGQLDTGGPILSAGSVVRGFLISYASDGAVRWALTSDAIGFAELIKVAVAPDGTVAVLGDDGAVTGARQGVAMLATDRSVRWSYEFGSELVHSMRTDGTSIVLAGTYGRTLTFAPEHVTDDLDGFIASIGEAGVDSVHVAAGRSTQHAYIDALLPGAIFAHVDALAEDEESAFTVGGAPVPAGGGVAILELAR